ncbi:MAG: transcriptional regulator FtsR [Mycobacteriales bacterium]
MGEVLSQLRSEFPDTTISKLRFLESEGLVEPERTTAGYRKYSGEDVARLRYVLTAQRDHYLPLKVIREQLGAIGSGITPSGSSPSAAGGAAGRLLRGLESVADAAQPGGENSAAADSVPEGRVTREQLLELGGADADLLTSLEQFGLVVADDRGHFADHDVAIVRAASDLAGYGIEPRHLRAFRGAADREVGLFQQVLTPMARQRGRAQTQSDPARDAATELCALSMALHEALMRAALDRVL